MHLRLIVAMLLLSSPAWGQHPGHTQSSPRRPAQPPDGPVLKLNDAVKASQVAFRELEKAVRSGDEARLEDAASRYQTSIDDLIRSVDASQDDRSYARNLGLAQRSLNRQLQQLEQLASAAPASAADHFTRLSDAVTLDLDDVLAQQKALRDSAQSSGSGHSGVGHGCGGILRRVFPPKL